MTISSAQPSRLRPLALVLGASPSPLARDGALVVARAVVAWIFVYYGAGKLFGAFGGPGLHRTALYFSQTAHLRPGGLFAVVGGVIEFGGALAIALGLVSRVAALALLGDQVMAIITVTWHNGINSLSATPGYEFNLTLCALSVVVIVFGAGRLSLDAVLARKLRA